MGQLQWGWWAVVVGLDVGFEAVWSKYGLEEEINYENVKLAVQTGVSWCVFDSFAFLFYRVAYLQNPSPYLSVGNLSCYHCISSMLYIHSLRQFGIPGMLSEGGKGGVISYCLFLWKMSCIFSCIHPPSVPHTLPSWTSWRTTKLGSRDRNPLNQLVARPFCLPFDNKHRTKV